MSEHPFFFTWSRQRDARPLAIRGGAGAWFDADGERWLDLGSLIYQANLGHGHPRLVRAVQEQASRLCLTLPSAVYPEKTALAQALLDRAPGDFSKVFFCLGGAEANEHALKIARLVTGKLKAISRYRSYHGASMGAVSLTGDWRRPPVEPGIGGVVHVLDLDLPPPPGSSSFIPRTLELEGGVAAVFLEPVVGGNGVLIPPADYFAEVRAACDAHGALLVVDEVLTGFGRTGRWFAIEHFGVEPDLVTCGKALTGGYGVLGAVLVHRRVAQHFDEQPLVSGLTHYAHPLGVAAALEALRVYEDDGLLTRAAQLEAALLGELAALCEAFPFIRSARALGLLGAVDCDLDEESFSRLRGAARRERVHLHFNHRCRALIVAPPLVIAEDELAEGFGRLRAALASL